MSWLVIAPHHASRIATDGIAPALRTAGSAAPHIGATSTDHANASTGALVSSVCKGACTLTPVVLVIPAGFVFENLAPEVRPAVALLIEVSSLQPATYSLQLRRSQETGARQIREATRGGGYQLLFRVRCLYTRQS